MKAKGLFGGYKGKNRRKKGRVMKMSKASTMKMSQWNPLFDTQYKNN